MKVRHSLYLGRHCIYSGRYCNGVRYCDCCHAVENLVSIESITSINVYSVNTSKERIYLMC